MTGRVLPPEAALEGSWHWLTEIYQPLEEAEPWEWRDGLWWQQFDWFAPDRMHMRGWRYHAPAPIPAATKKEPEA